MQRIIIIGDSHVHAPEGAIRKGFHISSQINLEVHRLEKIKNGQKIGSISFEELLSVCAGLSSNDIVVSMIGGNQHSILSLVKHPEPYDIADDNGKVSLSDNLVLIPRSAMAMLLERGLRKGDASRILTVAAAGSHRTFHVMAPPPKADVQHILARPETQFVERGIADHGVSPAPMRQRIWKLQNEVLRAILAEAGIPLLPPPFGTVTEDGFLHPDFYARDATHANAAYGARLLNTILAL